MEWSWGDRTPDNLMTASHALFHLSYSPIGLPTELRMAGQASLSKSEARHALARAVFAHSQGGIHDRSHGAQQRRVMALNLVIAALVYWNTSYMDKAANYLRRQGGCQTLTCLGMSPLWGGTTSP